METFLLQAATHPVKNFYFPDGMPGVRKISCFMDGYGSCEAFLSLYKARASRPNFLPLCLRRADGVLVQGEFEIGDFATFVVFTDYKVQVCPTALSCCGSYSQNEVNIHQILQSK